jgi:hypothetical protein
MKNEKRIYVVIPKYVIVNGKMITMSCGRLMAQVAHVVSKLKLRLKLNPDKEYTTIVFAIHNNSYLEYGIHRFDERIKRYKQNIPYEFFKDTNPEFYGTKESVYTAFAAMMTKRQSKSLFKELKLYECLGDGTGRQAGLKTQCRKKRESSNLS